MQQKAHRLGGEDRHLRAEMRGDLFTPKRHDDLFVAASKNYPTVFNSFDRDLINLGADLQAKLLAFRHRFAVDDREARSEEHTSELQSQFHLVCRLLLEKKKIN